MPRSIIIKLLIYRLEYNAIAFDVFSANFDID